MRFLEGDPCVEAWPGAKKMALLEVYGYRVRRDVCGTLYYVLDNPEHGKKDMSDEKQGLKSVTSQATYIDPTARWADDEETERTLFPMFPSFQELTSGFGINPSKHEVCLKIPAAAETTVQ